MSLDDIALARRARYTEGMMRRRPLSALVLSLPLLAACGSSSSAGVAPGPAAVGGQGGAGGSGGEAGNGGAVGGSGGAAGASGGGTSGPTEHGVMLDYFLLKPVAGMTVSDKGGTTTTDAKGYWSLPIPPGATVLQPIVSGPTYTQLLFPDVSFGGADVDHGSNVIPTTQAYMLEQNILTGFDPAKALVQVVVVASGACPTAAGGTVTVLTPSGTSVRYFSTGGIPSATLTSFQEVMKPRSAAVIYNVTPGADVTVQIAHPTCTPKPFPLTEGSVTFTGKVRTVAAEPGDANAALVVGLE